MNIKTVGLIFARKKIQRSGFTGLEDYAIKHNIRVIYIDLSIPIEKYGPLDLIVHKLTDVVARVKRGDKEAKIVYERFNKYTKEHPGVIIIDAWSNIEKVLDRMVLYKYTLISASERMKNGDPLFFIPKTIILDNSKKLDIQFPTLCKRITACSSREAHQMMLIPSVEGIDQIDKFIPDDPVMLQEFIQHDGVIVKVYVADGQISASTRPSFKNLDHHADIIYFDSQRLPKTFDHTVDIPDDLDRVFLTSDPGDIHLHKEALLDKHKLQMIANSLQRQLNLTFFGFDVLLQSKTNAYYVVDVNYFPSYKDVHNFHSMFVNILKKRLW